MFLTRGMLSNNAAATAGKGENLLHTQKGAISEFPTKGYPPIEHMQTCLAKGPIACFQLFVEPELLQKYMTQHLGLPAPLLGSARHCIFWYVKTDWENTRDQLPTNLCPCRHLAAASQRPEFRRDDQIYSLGSGSVYKHNHHKNSRTHKQNHYGEDNPKNRYPGKRPTCCYHTLASG